MINEKIFKKAAKKYLSFKKKGILDLLDAIKMEVDFPTKLSYCYAVHELLHELGIPLEDYLKALKTNRNFDHLFILHSLILEKAKYLKENYKDLYDLIFVDENTGDITTNFKHLFKSIDYEKIKEKLTFADRYVFDSISRGSLFRYLYELNNLLNTSDYVD